MNPETILIIAIVVLAAVAAYYGLRSRGSQPDEELYRLDVKLSSELKDELQGNFDDDEDLMVESQDDTSSHHVTRSLISDEEPEAFRPRDYYGMSAAKPQVADEDEKVAAEEAPEVEDSVEEEPLSEQPGIEGTLEFEEQEVAESEEAHSVVEPEEAPESIVEEEPAADTEPEPVAQEEVVSEVESEEVAPEAVEEVAELPVSRASLPVSQSQVVVEAPDESEIEAEAKFEEENSEVEAEAEVTVEQAAEVHSEDATEVAEPVAEIQEVSPAPPEPVVTPQSETILVENEAPKPKGLFARFTGVVSKAEPVDLSDADDEFEAIDQPVDETSETSVLAELNPELAERLANLNERLEGLGGIVNDLEETLSFFEEPEFSEGSGSDESSRREDEQLAA